MHLAAPKCSSTRRAFTSRPGAAELLGEPKSASSSGMAPTLAAGPGDSTRRQAALAIRAGYSSSRQSLQRMMVPGGYSKSVSPHRLKPAFRQMAFDAG